jgi:hypothetical protein
LVAPISIIDEPTTQTAGLTVVPELIEVETTETETRTEVISIVETETRTTFHVVEDHTEPAHVPEVEHYEPDVFEIKVEEPEVLEEPVEEVVEVPEQEPAQEIKSEEPYSPAKNQSTSRWAEVLFGSKDDEED